MPFQFFKYDEAAAEYVPGDHLNDDDGHQHGAQVTYEAAEAFDEPFEGPDRTFLLG
ncbi:MAG: hypothetical protein JRJ60_04820 [Deltaproteobacteria bacterium]|nr:hypothetical protein [Deltaproteobacteria bacterium]